MSFASAFESTMGHEGNYSNDPKDPGGETFMGISRVYHPDWVGWAYIDFIKRTEPKELQESYFKKSQELMQAVKTFYYNAYWLPIKGDKLPGIIGEELFDSAVNLGKKTAVKILQKSLNLLNRNGRLFEDLVVDGIIGNKTLSAVKSVDKRRLLKVMNGYQFMRYAQLMEDDPNLERFVGWFNRV